jgi:uncharacterized protein (TIGR02284 family)
MPSDGFTQGTHDVRVLNALIASALSSAETRREAAGRIRNDQLRSILLECADGHDDVTMQIQAYIRNLGGEADAMAAGPEIPPRNTRPVSALASEKGINVLFGDLVRDAATLAAKFEAVLADRELSTPTRNVVRDCLFSISASRDQLSDMIGSFTEQTTSDDETLIPQRSTGFPT